MDWTPHPLDHWEWTPCYMCDYWVHNPLDLCNFDGFSKVLWNWCYDWVESGGGPYEPTARQRRAKFLDRLFEEKLPETVCATISEMLHEWHEP